MSRSWAIVEHSGRFWMVVQRKEKRKKINEVLDASDHSHDTMMSLASV